MKKERKLVILPESKLACSQIQKINSILKEKAPNQIWEFLKEKMSHAKNNVWMSMREL